MDPFDAEKEAAALDRRLGVIRDNLARHAGRLPRTNYAIRENADDPASITVEVPPVLVVEGGDVAEMQICEVDSWILVEVGAGPNGADAIVNPDVASDSVDGLHAECRRTVENRGRKPDRPVGGTARMPRSVVVALVTRCVQCWHCLPSCTRPAATRPTTDRAALVSVEGDTVTVECRDPAPTPGPARPIGVVGAPQPCRWVPATAADGWDPSAYGDISPSGYVFFETGDGSSGADSPTVARRWSSTGCVPTESGFTWVDVTVTVQDAIDDAVDRARRAVPAPQLDISPPPEAGGIVNLGMWLALLEQDR